MGQIWVRLTLLASLAWATAASADVLETRDGRVLEGTYLGGTEQALRFRAGEEVEVFLVEEVASLRFARTLPRPAAEPRPKLKPPAPAPARPATPAPAKTNRAAPQAPPTPAPPAPAPAAAPKSPPPRAAATPAPAPAAAPTTPAAPKLARVPAGTRLRVRVLDGIDARKAAVGDRFAASLENGLGIDGVAILPVGTKLYGRVSELRATGPVASRLKLELTQLMLRGELMDIVTATHQPAEVPEPGPASASTIPVRPGVDAGSVLEFRLLQPFEVRIQ